MKSVRLKPLYLKADEILIQPPKELSKTVDYSLPQNSTMTISSIDNLASILRGRSLRSTKSRRQEPLQEEKESVLKLSDFKVKFKKISPIKPRLTFRRTLSNLSQENSPAKQFQKKLAEPTPSIESLISAISIKEPGNIKQLENEFIKYTETNKKFEAGLIFEKKENEIKINSTNKKIADLKNEIYHIEKSLKQEETEYQEKMSMLAFQNTEGLLSLYTINGKKKANMEVSQEHEYLHLKQQLRKAQADIHAQYIENKEKFNEKLEAKKSALDTWQDLKNKIQKEVKDSQETLIAFYCRTLKDGMDLRDDGLRWCIKAIWKTSHPVPVSSFPSYLDEGSVTFLLKIAQFDLEIKALTSKLQVLRNEMKRNHLFTSMEKPSSEVFRGIKERLKMISQTSKVVKVKGNVEIKGSLKENDLVASQTPDLCEIKEKIKEKERLINKLSEDEIRRIAENYNNVNHSVGILHIVRSLVGDKMKNFRVLAQRSRPSFLKTIVS